MNELLNDSQWNSLRNSILAFEQRLRHAQQWLNGLEEKGIFYRRRLSLSAENREEARQQIERAITLLDELGSKLGVSLQEETVNGELRGEFAVSWANWLDSRADKLGRFGHVHPTLERELDPAVEQLAEIANLLAAIFGEPNKEKP